VLNRSLDRRAGCSVGVFSLGRPRLGCFLLHRLPGDMGMLVRRCLGQLRDVGDNSLNHPSQRSDLLGETKERLSCHDGRPEAWRNGRELGVRGSEPQVVEQPLVTIRCGAQVRQRRWGSKLPAWIDAPSGTSTQGSVDLSLGPSRGWRSCTKASLEMGGVTQRGPSDAQVRRNPEWPSRESKVWGSREKGVGSRERASPFTCYRSKCFIPMGGELARTPNLTFVVSRNMAETYGGCAAAAVWGEGMTRHATLIGVG
ncbi:hypothetical protein B296_00057050, partial [Ensete ventricosum]